MKILRRLGLIAGGAVLLILALVVAPARTTSARDDDNGRNHQVVVPGEDRFVSFAITIRAGDIVTWLNQDTDNHTVVSDDFFNNTGPRNVNQLLVGTDQNHGQPGQVRLRFDQPGTFVYYCRFHSQLDAQHQPIAPGPDGGIQGPGTNFGTPMMGVITVLPGNGQQGQQGQQGNGQRY